jgi:ribonuclease Z
MPISLPFRNLEPTFAAGLIDDPVLLVRIRPTGGCLMFDCGQIHHLAKRSLTCLDAVFISHAHMDHWMGIDSVVRHLHASSKVVDLFGPPGIADKFGHKLASYDWNLAEDYWGSFRVHEVFPDKICLHLFPGPERFCRQVLAVTPREEHAPIYRTPYCQVFAQACEHRVASLVFRINETPGFSIDREKLSQHGLLPGPWLGELKRSFLRGGRPTGVLNILKKDAAGKPREVASGDLETLLRQIERPQRSAAIGYVSDVGFSAANCERILHCMQGVNLLVCECAFLKESKERARASHHLCTDDLNWLMEALRPDYLLPMHFSKTFSRRAADLYRELVPPPGTRLLQLPLRRTPRPLLVAEMGWQLHAEI